MQKGKPLDPTLKSQMLEEMKKLESENMSRAAIARHMNISGATVTRYLGAVHKYKERRMNGSESAT